MDPLVSQPIVGLDAFTSDANAAKWSLSAQLLILAGRFAGKTAAPNPKKDTTAVPDRTTDATATVETATVETPDEDAVGTPTVRPLPRGSQVPHTTGALRSTPAQLWTALNASGDPYTAVTLLLSQLDNPSEIARVSAAASLIAIDTEIERARTTLTNIQRFTSPTARAMVALALGTPVRAPGARQAKPRVSPPQSIGEVSIGIAGTFGRWRSPQLTPGGELFALLKDKLSPDLYSDPESYYRWTGGYSEAARLDAAADLERWLATSGSARRLDSVYAHSHGGNVALDAVMLGIPIRFLLLIDTPALRRSGANWSEINGRVGRAVSLRSRLDLVLILDRLLHGGAGGPGSDGIDFDASFDCRVLSPPVWFSHTAMLRPAVWEKYGLVDQVRYEQSLVTKSS